jgi:hypothetical protein
LATARLGDYDGRPDGGMSRTLLHVVTDWPESSGSCRVYPAACGRFAAATVGDRKVSGMDASTEELWDAHDEEIGGSSRRTATGWGWRIAAIATQ